MELDADSKNQFIHRVWPIGDMVGIFDLSRVTGYCVCIERAFKCSAINVSNSTTLPIVRALNV